MDFDKFVENLVKDVAKTNPKLVKIMKNVANDVKDHEFDENSNICKKCSSFKRCKLNHIMTNKIKSANIEDNIKETLIDFIDWIQHEDKLFEIFNVNTIIEDKEFKLHSLINRFEDCEKHLAVLTDILDGDELKYIRKIVRGITNKIDEAFETIMNINRGQMNKLVFILQKVKDEPKRYEDMTREELLAELNKK